MPLFGMIVRYCPASSPKRAITRRMRSMPLRGSTPRWSPARYVVPAGSAISMCRVDRSAGLPFALRISSRLARTRAGRAR